ncbi:MAG: NAD-dependent epimerase/dehydratase family protein [Gammaproteobacteria bacterium]|nr:NAD-dependent epimerase/dehydratase family protein [Gammaproteobacteria bacterium]
MAAVRVQAGATSGPAKVTLKAKATRPVVAVFGISSQAGQPLVDHLQRDGYCVHGISRQLGWSRAGIVMHHFDQAGLTVTPPLSEVFCLISLAPLPGLGALLPHLDSTPALRRVIAFGTTGIFTKADSSSPTERAFVESQIHAARHLATWSERRGIVWTVLRPTMMYGVNRDQNVVFIRSIFRRFSCLTLPIGARGVRQPVHVDDLAAACVSVLGHPATANKAYNLGGGEVLLYEDMVRRIRSTDGHRPILIPVPRLLYYLLIFGARTLLGQSYLRIEMVDRMYADLVTDNGAATADFGYSPRPFEPPGLI